ncbi:MAG: YdiU family protein [Flavobacteriia bacterium]|nr:YdiU family protein [Flavobacteriia bacterium]
MKFIADPFIGALSKDPSSSNTPRTVPHGFYSEVHPKKVSKPQLLHANPKLLKVLGISQEDIQDPQIVELLSGQALPEQLQPYAMNYGGHQFGHWAGQLGDGRAIHLGSLQEINEAVQPADQTLGKIWQLQLKGAGPTPYSRTADGLAVLRSSIREYLCSEAMHALGVPSTRALSLVLTGDQVLRDVLYNGNPAYEPGAIVSRMAPNFIRFGSFELPATRGQKEALKELADACITYHFPHIKQKGTKAYVAFFEEVCQRTAALVLNWQRVGFVHGVLNTDNMSILGLTIDYGPYGWLEPYDPDWTPNTTDAAQRRYRFGNQSQVGLWNLYQLANALYPIVGETAPLEAALEAFKNDYERGYQDMMAKKIGLSQLQKKGSHQKREAIAKLIASLEETLCLTETDMTIFFRTLSQWEPVNTPQANKKADASYIFGPVYAAFYSPEELEGTLLESWKNWLTSYKDLLHIQDQNTNERRIQMNAVNPKYVLRNYMAQLAIEKAEKGDYSLVSTLFELLQKPYDEQPTKEEWFAKRPEWAKNKVGSSQLSCSS